MKNLNTTKTEKNKVFINHLKNKIKTPGAGDIASW